MTTVDHVSIARFASWASRHWPGTDRDDLAQEAAVVAMETQGFGPIQRMEVGRRAAHWRSPVTTPRTNVLARGYDLSSIRAVEWTELPGHGDSAPSPEALLVAAQFAARMETLGAAILAAEQHAARGLPRFVREMGAVVHAGRHSRIHVELAARFGLSVAQVVSSLGRYNRAARRSREARALRAALEELKREILS